MTFNPAFGARVGYAFPLSLTVYGVCLVFVWLAVDYRQFIDLSGLYLYNLIKNNREVFSVRFV